MCDNRDLFEKDSKPVPYCDRDHCNIYNVHQHGDVFCHPSVQFRYPEAESTTNRNAESDDDAGSDDDAESFCGDDRLTLIHLPSKDDPVGSPSPQVEAESECLQEILPAKMPKFFRKKLKKICEHCECKQKVLWNNFLRDEQHFDACFRYVNNDNKENTLQRKCFLKLYTLRVPFLSDLTVSFSMVHHVRAEGEEFVPASADKKKAPSQEQEKEFVPASADKAKAPNQEHMFAFIYGLNGKQMQTLLTGLVYRWQDIAHDHSKLSTGITPRLFVAALISQYGSVISKKIQIVYKNLRICDKDLQKAIKNLEKEKEKEPDLASASARTKQIGEINQNLIDMNIELTGTKSTMHYLAESADVMVIHITPFEEYVKARLNEWHATSERTRSKKEPGRLNREKTMTFNTKLLDALQELDSCSERIRDHDKLVMVRKNMLQYKTDIESLQQHININVGMVSNVIAARDRSIQQSIMANTGRDGAKMKFMAILTAFFLPGTFMAVLLTTPMFNLTDDTKPLLTKRGIPLAIYWGVTGLGCIFLLIVSLLLHKQRSLKLKAKVDEKNGNEDGAAHTETPTGNSEAKPGEKSHQANGMNGKSTSTGRSSRGGSTLLTSLFRKGRIAPLEDAQV